MGSIKVLYCSTQVCPLLTFLNLTHPEISSGGPGGSGVSLVLSVSPSMRKLIGDEFDFIGFDARGMCYLRFRAH